MNQHFYYWRPSTQHTARAQFKRRAAWHVPPHRGQWSKAQKPFAGSQTASNTKCQWIPQVSVNCIHAPHLQKAFSNLALTSCQMSGVQNFNQNWMEIIHPCAKSLRNPCATTMGVCARSTFLIEFGRPCAKMISWDLVHFSLRDAGAKLISDLGLLASQILGFSARSVVLAVASRLLGSTQRSSYFSSSLAPECLQWAYGPEPKNKLYSGTSIVANIISLLPVSELVRTLREIQDVWKVLPRTSSHATIKSMPYYHSNQRVNIPSKQCNKETTELLTHLVPSVV